MGILGDLSKLVKEGTTVLSNAASAANDGLAMLSNTIQDGLENQEYERKQDKILARLEADIDFAKEYKRLFAKLKLLGLSRKQIQEILEKNLPKEKEVDIDITELLNN